MSEFLLILNENPSGFAGLSMDEIQRTLSEYIAWRASLEAADRLIGANKLTEDGGRVLTVRDGQVRVNDGPYAEVKEVVGGYFLIRASSYDDAVEIARTCPHLKYGGRVEIRQVDDHARIAGSNG